MSATDPQWSDAVRALALFAIDPAGTGLVLRARPGPAREPWLAALRRMLPSSSPWRAVPLHVSDERLLGGLDLAATLRAAHRVASRGLLAEADGGVIQLAMAERVSARTAAHIAAAIDTRTVTTTRDGVSRCDPATFGVIALDEGIDDEAPPPALTDRLAFWLQLDDLPALPLGDVGLDAETIARARARLAVVRADAQAAEALSGATLAFGISSLRAVLLALAAARAAAALEGRDTVKPDDVALAARLVLAPRATILPQTQPPEEDDSAAPPDDPGEGADARDPDDISERPLDDVVLAAVQAAIPADVLAALNLGGGPRRSARTAGKSGAQQASLRHGRPVGTRRGELRSGARLNLVATLRVAAPWQSIRRREGAAADRIAVRRDDLRVTRFRRRRETVAVFVVDASGSAALHRLAEAKGAVELLLADCYVRRDQVALLAFRGRQAELLLPPTRSLVRAKRTLAALPGGGGTPLAAAIDAAAALADGIARKGQTPVLVFLTDGRANVARDGSAGREKANEDALAAARVLRAAQLTALLLDTSPQPQPAAARVATEMGARYLPLPHADAARLSRAVIGAMPV
jgi:magnesium chelatase subunit D